MLSFESAFFPTDQNYNVRKSPKNFSPNLSENQQWCFYKKKISKNTHNYVSVKIQQIDIWGNR